MGILFNELILFAVAIVVAVAFILYSAIVIRKNGTMAYFAHLFRKLKLIGTTLAGFAGTLVGLLAASGDTSGEDDATEGDLTGAYNFRTRKFDNGTDPYGWYEEDL